MVDEDIAVCGKAFSDPDFQGGMDTVRFQVNLNEAQGPFTVVAELLYQSIGYRWAQNLRGLDAPEPLKYSAYYENLPNLPMIVSSDSTEVDG